MTAGHRRKMLSQEDRTTMFSMLVFPIYGLFLCCQLRAEIFLVETSQQPFFFFSPNKLSKAKVLSK